MEKYKSRSTEIPKELDTLSSESTVYRNTNVVALPLTGDNAQMFEYDVEKYTKAEYESTLIEQNRADIDYVSIMTGVDL